ncbi:MAG: hypothetical protein EOM37_16395 [Proteobacteria bacterium]|nr:hypothetical protein [Pseudomonadota bacterium]
MSHASIGNASSGTIDNPAARKASHSPHSLKVAKSHALIRKPVFLNCADTFSGIPEGGAWSRGRGHAGALRQGSKKGRGPRRGRFPAMARVLVRQASDLES